MKEKHEYLIYALVLFLVFVFFFSGGNLITRVVGLQYPLMVVVSESMTPNLGVGDFIIVGNLDNPGEIVVGSPPSGEILVYDNGLNEYIVHRAIEKFNENGKWWFKMKGDNNQLPDLMLIPEDIIIGRVTGRIPILGYFSVFTKTISGFAFTAFFMVLAFFYDLIIPLKNKTRHGKFPFIYIAPFIVPVTIVFSHWFIKSNQVFLDIFAIVTWYFGCLLLPISLVDDDSGIMFWLYHFVLIMIPIACDFTWFVSGITPSQWWAISGGTIPVNWFLVKETFAYQRFFRTVLNILVPGSVIFISLLVAKRFNNQQISYLQAKLRSLKHCAQAQQT